MVLATRILTGFDLAARLNAGTRRRAETLPRRPSCAVLLDLSNPAMRAYGERQRASAEAAGVDLRLVPYADGAPTVLAQLREFAEAPDVDAVATLYPLPAGVDPLEAAQILGAAKDIDGLHPTSAGLLALGAPARAPATAQACLLCARELLGPLKGAEVVVVGASRIVGRPLALMLLDEEATVTVCHAGTRDLAAHTRRADLVVTAAGVAGLIGADHVKAGAAVIDVAIVRTAGGLVGDVDRAAVSGKAAAVTHVPDGVGPVTTACLLRNVVDAAEERAGRQ